MVEFPDFNKSKISELAKGKNTKTLIKNSQLPHGEISKKRLRPKWPKKLPTNNGARGL